MIVEFIKCWTPEDKRMSMIAVGDMVAYSAGWLRSMGAYTGILPFARGKVLKIDERSSFAIAQVDWDNDEIPPRVNVKNLVKVGSPQFCRGE